MFGGHSCLRVGWAGFVPSFAMDKFCEVRGQILYRRGTPVHRAQCLSESCKISVTAISVCCSFSIFSAGLVVGFFLALVYLINS